MSEVSFPNPLFHGDTVRVRTSVLGKRESKSRPDAGLIEFEHIATKQSGEIVARCKRMAMMKRKG